MVFLAENTDNEDQQVEEKRVVIFFFFFYPVDQIAYGVTCVLSI
jgi:hypothetical protein